MFFGESVDVARYDIVKYPQFEKLTDKQLSFFWRPEEIDLSRDSKDFRLLTNPEKHTFTSVLKRQIVLDSVQGRAPSLAFLPVCSLPELETFIQTWAFSETIHSRSYTHIIRNVYPNPSIVFDEIMDIPEILDCAIDISKYYDSLINWNTWSQRPPDDTVGGWSVFHEYEHKKKLWLCLNAVNALEGIRFYASFAASWNFAELKKMEGNAKIIKLIARDENVHLAATQQMIKLLPKDDPDFVRIAEETQQECVEIFESVFEQECRWAEYLFKDGSMIGLNEKLLKDYLEWIANKRMTAIGLPTKYKNGSNPLPWTQKWISGSDVQVAPQEVEITSYLSGSINKDVKDDSFIGCQL
jgi:ribonucleoside-diphosphate reductase beta chain